MNIAPYNIAPYRDETISPYSVSAFSSHHVEYDVLAEIRREDARRAQARKNARKQRARELTKARELEIKKAEGGADEQ